MVAYYRAEPVQAISNRIAEFKVAHGLAFSFFAGAIAGAGIPEVAKVVTGRVRRLDRAEFGKLAWTAVVYGIVGVTVDIFYRYQAVWFGAGIDPKTLTIKTVVDMFVFAPFLSIPMACALFGWWKAGYSIAFWKRAFTIDFYKREVAPAMPLCWAFWIPMLICTYSLPSTLQFPFAVLGEGAWSVLFVFMVTQPSGASHSA